MFIKTKRTEYGYTDCTTANEQPSFSARFCGHNMSWGTVVMAVSIFVLSVLAVLVSVSVLAVVVLLLAVRIFRLWESEVNTQCETPRRPVSNFI